jgi:membrane protein
VGRLWQRGDVDGLPSFLRRLARTFPARVGLRFAQDGGGSLAVLIAWNALTALFPIALALAAIAGAVLSRAGVARDKIAEAVLTLLPEGAGRAQALEAIGGVQQATGVFALVAVVGFLWTASGLFGAMEQAFSVIFRSRQRSFLRQKLMSLAMMATFAILALLGVGSSALVPFLGELAHAATVPSSFTHGVLAPAVQAGIGFVAGFLLYFAIYLVVPNRPMQAAQVWPGALFAGAAFEGLTQLFPVYIRLNRGINQYGRSFALLFVLLAFFYFLGMITVLGAELIAVLHPADEAAEPVASHPVPRPRGWRRLGFGLLGAAIGAAALRRRRA